MNDPKDHDPVNHSESTDDFESPENPRASSTVDRKDRENTVEVDVADLKAQLLKASSDYLYLRAEFDNFRKQSIKERSELLRFGGERLAKDLLDSLDIFETALASDVGVENFKNFVDGIRMTAQQLATTLQRHGITDVVCDGKLFDPMIAEALSSEPTDKVPVGYVTRVFKKPYKYHDKILRVGQVVVAKAND